MVKRTIQILAIVWITIVIPVVLLQAWIYIGDPLFWPPATSDIAYTHMVTKDGKPKRSITLGETVFIKGRGKKLRDDCFPKFHRVLVTPRGERIKLVDGDGFLFRAGDGGGIVEIPARLHTTVGEYYYYSWGIWNCDFSHTQHRTEGWSLKYEVVQ